MLKEFDSRKKKLPKGFHSTVALSTGTVGMKLGTAMLKEIIPNFFNKLRKAAEESDKHIVYYNRWAAKYYYHENDVKELIQIVKDNQKKRRKKYAL